jgi:hypothetical protein
VIRCVDNTVRIQENDRPLPSLNRHLWSGLGSKLARTDNASVQGISSPANSLPDLPKVAFALKSKQLFPGRYGHG